MASCRSSGESRVTSVRRDNEAMMSCVVTAKIGSGTGCHLLSLSDNWGMGKKSPTGWGANGALC